MSELVLEELGRVREELSQLREEVGLHVGLLDTRAVCDRYGCDERTARKAMRSTGRAFTLAGRLRVHLDSLVELEQDLARRQNAPSPTSGTAPSSRRASRPSADELGAGWWRT